MRPHTGAPGYRGRRLKWRTRCPAHNLDELAERAGVSRERARQLVNHALCKLRWWARLADVVAADRAQVRSDMLRRQAEAAAARARHLRALHARAPEVWQWIERFVASQSHYEHAYAVNDLCDLREAAELVGERPAYEARFEELRRRFSMPQQQAFWAHWSEAERARTGRSDRASRQGA